MQRLRVHTLILGGLLSLLVGCGEVGSGGSSISGTVMAPAGADVSGTTVFACYNDEPGCERLGETTISQSGNAAPYRLGTLAQGPYSVYALNDTNGDGVPNTGDYYGYFGRNSGRAILVSPPQANVNLEMLVFSGNTALRELPETLQRAIAQTP